MELQGEICFILNEKLTLLTGTSRHETHLCSLQMQMNLLTKPQRFRKKRKDRPKLSNTPTPVSPTRMTRLPPSPPLPVPPEVVSTPQLPEHHVSISNHMSPSNCFACFFSYPSLQTDRSPRQSTAFRLYPQYRLRRLPSSDQQLSSN